MLSKIAYCGLGSSHNWLRKEVPWISAASTVLWHNLGVPRRKSCRPWDPVRRTTHDACAFQGFSGNSGRHSGQEPIFRALHMALGWQWKIFDNGDRGSTQKFDTNLVSIVVWSGEPFWEKCLFWSYFQHYHVHFSRNMFPECICSLNIAVRKEL